MKEEIKRLLEGLPEDTLKLVTGNMLANPRLEGLGEFNPFKSAFPQKRGDRIVLFITTSSMKMWLNAWAAAHGVEVTLNEQNGGVLFDQWGNPFMQQAKAELLLDGKLVATGIAGGLYESYHDRNFCVADATLLQSASTKALRRCLENAGFGIEVTGAEVEDLPQFPIPEEQQTAANDSKPEEPAESQPAPTQPAEAPKKRGRRKKTEVAAAADAAENAPAQEAPAEEPPAQEVTAEKTPAETVPAEPAPVEKAPVAAKPTKSGRFATKDSAPTFEKGYQPPMTLEEAMGTVMTMPPYAGKKTVGQAMAEAKNLDVLLERFGYWSGPKFSKADKYRESVEAVRTVYFYKVYQPQLSEE